jgi:transposase
VLCGILFVLYTGIRWEFLPQELGFSSGITCWRRLRDWNEAGVWQKLHELLLSELRDANLLDFSRAAVDSSHIRAMKDGPATGPSPWIGAKPAASTMSSSTRTASRWP